MKIIDFTPYYPPHIGGVEAYAKELHGELLRDGVEAITVFTPRLPDDAPETEIFGNLTVIRYPALELVPNFPLPKFWSSTFRKLFAQVRRQKFDLTVTHTRFFVSSLVALYYAKRTRTPFIHIEHGSDFVQSKSFVVSTCAWIYDQTFGRLVIGQAARVIAISKAVEVFVRKVYSRHTTVILRGMDNEAIEAVAASREVEGQYRGKFVITFLGRLIEGKGIIDLFNAVAKLSSSDAVCFLIGDGPQRAELEGLAETLGIKDRVVFWGFQPHDVAIGLIKNSDVFVNPSYTEGLPTTVIEAALCKTAIIATDVGGTSEIIADGKSGFLVPARDQGILTEKLQLLMDDPKLRENLAGEAYREVREKFDWKKSSATFMKIFTEASGRKR